VLEPRARHPEPSSRPRTGQPAVPAPTPPYAHPAWPQGASPHQAAAFVPPFVHLVPGAFPAPPGAVPGTPGRPPRREGPVRRALRRLAASRRTAPVVAVLLAGVLTADLVALGALEAAEEAAPPARTAVAAREPGDPHRYVAATRDPAGASGGADAGTAGQAEVAPLERLREPHLFVVAGRTLPASAVARVRRLKGVAAVETADAAVVTLDGKRVHTLGVNPSTFRAYTPEITARSDALWRNIAAGDVAVSFVLGRDGGVALGAVVDAGGRRLRVGAWATVGIGPIDAVVSHDTARLLGMPERNALVVSAPGADLGGLRRRMLRVLPKGAQVAVIDPGYVEPRRPARERPADDGTAGGGAGDAAGGGRDLPEGDADRPAGSFLSDEQRNRVLAAAASRIGRPYAWGAAGPDAFDCSGLVQWAYAQAEVRMPRVTTAQWATGPRIPLSEALPGDLLFWRRDPTNPGYISHVAIYWGDGRMLHAPRTGDVVKIAPIDMAGFAGAVRVDPEVAARVR